jgi:hypothetical protein
LPDFDRYLSEFLDFAGNSIHDTFSDVNRDIGQAVRSPQTYETLAETGLGMAPGSGEALSLRDAWQASGKGAEALQQGNLRDAAVSYSDLLTGLLGAIPGAGIIARGTKRGAAWMDRNLPAGLNRAMDAMTPTNMQDVAPAFPAWHGSPHDFVEFKLDKIGTGEGAQAYGQGLYFAQNPEVAKSYRETLTRDKEWVTSTGQKLPTWIGERLSGGNPMALDDMIKTFEVRLADAQQQMKTHHQPWVYESQAENISSILDTLKGVRSGDVTISPPKGRLYNVEVDAELD